MKKLERSKRRQRTQVGRTKPSELFQLGLEGDRWFVWILAVLASISILSVRYEPSLTRAWLSIEWLLIVLATGTMRALFLYGFHSPSTQTKSRQADRFWFVLAVVLTILPQVDKWLQASLGMAGEATELVWLAMVQNGALCVAARAQSARHHWLVLLLSTFLMLFGLATSDRSENVLLVAFYGILLAWWFMAKHWEGLQQGFVASETIPLIRLRVIAIGSVVLVVSVLGGVALKQKAAARMLDGFMPTSGGNQGADDSARNGVGNGEMLVAAKDQAVTFGPVDSELFLESDLPTLYDLASDMFGEPSAQRRKMQPTVAINAIVQETKENVSESKKSSKEFSTVRKASRPKKEQSLDGTKSNAVLYVIGRTPLHLRLESFDHFDGVDWTQSEAIPFGSLCPEPKLETHGTKPWIRLAEYPRGLIHPVAEPLALKLIGYRSPRILSPSLMTHVHIDQIDRPDFFGWTQDGQSMLRDRDTIPPLTILRQSHVIPQLHSLRHASAGHPLFGSESPSLMAPLASSYLQVAKCEVDLRGEAIRRAGIAGIGSWRTVEAIVASLQEDAVFDREVRVPETCDDAVAFFLEHRKGPDYLFATTAAMLLRSIDYPCRLVSGFYASPKRYDLRSGQTEVLREDLHTWIEVYSNGIWIPVETTPTFAAPLESRTWNQWAIESAWWFRDAIRLHPWRCVAIVTAIVLMVAQRRQLADRLITCVCIVAGSGAIERRLQWTLRLLQWRSWLYPKERTRMVDMPGTTLAKWAKHQLNAMRTPLTLTQIDLFIEAIQRLNYAPRLSATPWLQAHHSDLVAICKRVFHERFSPRVQERRISKPL